MENDTPVMLEIDAENVIVFSEQNGWVDYSTPLFLCEIYENLQAHFEKGIPCNEFFNYQDPEGAFLLLKEFFEKTNNLQHTTLDEFETFRLQCGISLNYEIGNEKFKQLDPSLKMAFKRFETELEKWRKRDVSIREYDTTVMRYFSLDTMADFVFSLLHYYVFHKYRIVRCKHCGKIFATNKKEDYCERSSPFPGYEAKSCKAAVKAIKDALEKRRKAEYERLRLKSEEYGFHSKHCRIWCDFCDCCNNYKKELKKGASVELLAKYKEFLYDSNGTRPKYERIKNW